MARSAGFPPRTVLVVDDEAAVRRLAHRILSEEGVRVFEAGDGQEALEVLRTTGPVDLILVDVVMPHVDGAALVRHLRSTYPAQPILYMSAYPAEVLARHGETELDLPFLAKPFSREELLGKMAEALARASAVDPRRTDRR